MFSAQLIYNPKSLQNLIFFVVLVWGTLLFAQEEQRDATFVFQQGPLASKLVCGVPESSVEEVLETRKLVNNQRLKKSFEMASINVAIPVAFHVIREDDGSYYDVTNLQLQGVIDSLNSHFEGSGFCFVTHSIERINNSSWTYHDAESPEREEMMRLLSYSPSFILNFYICVELYLDGKGVAGYATFPWMHPEAPYLHGVVVEWASIAGGEYPYTENKFGTHEVGHYLGLRHTFENGCDEPGDGIADTPYHSKDPEDPDWSCDDETLDTCEGQPGLDPIHNYMNYVSEFCMNEFTPGQMETMFLATSLYRPGLLIEASENDILLHDITYTSTENVVTKANNTITAGPNIIVEGNADVSFIAGDGINLLPGVTVQPQSRLRLVIAPMSNRCLIPEILSSSPIQDKSSGLAQDIGRGVPAKDSLSPNYPNPFNPTTTIKYALKENAKVSLKIYDVLGREVRTLVNEHQSAGFKEVVWDGRNELGQPVGSGVYTYRLMAGSHIGTRTMIMMK